MPLVFFGNVEKKYKYVDITLKSWSEMCWENRIKCIEALSYQAEKVREALPQVRNNATDSVVAAISLAEEIGSFRCQICCAVWFDILPKTNITSRLLQLTNIQHVAVNLVHRNKSKLCKQMSTEVVLKEKRLHCTKRHFAYEAADEPTADDMKRLEVSFCNAVVTESS